MKIELLIEYDRVHGRNCVRRETNQHCSKTSRITKLAFTRDASYIILIM